LATVLELIEVPQSRHNALPRASAFSAVFDDLEVGPGSRGHSPEEHGALRGRTP
jgi:hypothetical protein